MDHHDRHQQKDLVLNSNEFAYVLDKTKGNISVWVGPVKTSLSTSDALVIFDENTKRFEERRLEEAIQNFIIAPENWYITLKNPDKNSGHPADGKSSETPKLQIGRKVNINGPSAFALYPGQMARVIRGHHLRSNQYLLVRVYDEETAKENWNSAVVKKVETPPTNPAPSSSFNTPNDELEPGITTDASQETAVDSAEIPETASLNDINSEHLTVGKVIVIKGTEVSFYIPPTGIEVLGIGQSGKYVREAITLERLEYCILKDENGTKRYVKGPAVVFPEPTEEFIMDNNSPKFRAIELSPTSGIYVKVIADYTDENSASYKTGEEIFITGKEQMIYFPRPEHAFIKYGENIVHHATAIPKGNGRYVLDRLSGDIKTIKGPLMYLADPRKEVLVQRKLTDSQASLWYPGNAKVMQYNAELGESVLSDSSLSAIHSMVSLNNEEMAMFKSRSMTNSLSTNTGENVVDGFNRKQTFTKPRTITIDDNERFDGVVQIGVWTGYAINVISKDGKRKVVEGPCTYNMEYDETLEILEFSTGKPKTTDRLERSVYLRTTNNKISDVVTVETNDLVSVNLQVSYNVNFTGDSSKWFSVENYVKFLTDHMRSRLKRTAKDYCIEDFYENATSIIRDTILGEPPELKEGETRKPRTRLFKENGMCIEDVEVLGVGITDGNIRALLMDSQDSAIRNRLALNAAAQKEATDKKLADYIKAEEARKLELQTLTLDNQAAIQLKQHEGKVAANKAAQELQTKTLEAAQSLQTIHDDIAKAELARLKAKDDQEIAKSQAVAEVDKYAADAKAEAIKTALEGISPQLAASIQYAADIDGIGQIAAQLSPLAIVNGTSIADTANKLLQGTALEGIIRNLVGTKAPTPSDYDD